MAEKLSRKIAQLRLTETMYQDLLMMTEYQGRRFPDQLRFSLRLGIETERARQRKDIDVHTGQLLYSDLIKQSKRGAA